MLQNLLPQIEFAARRALGIPVSRGALARLVPENARALEIGPATRPTIRGPNVEYFDIMDGDELSARDGAKSLHIHYVSPSGDLSLVPSGSFDVVFSAHCIEHQPDLVGHLLHVRRILKSGGRYLIVIPDRRYCFDHFFPNSTIDQARLAHSEKRTFHTVESHARHLTLTTHNDARRHWAGDHGSPAGADQFDSTQKASLENKIRNGIYTDCHAWQFTPESFESIITDLPPDFWTALNWKIPV